VNDLKDVIEAMNKALDVMENPKGFGPEAYKDALHGLADATNALQEAQTQLNAHAAKTTVLDAVETVQ
jgi:hypothetical protein